MKARLNQKDNKFISESTLKFEINGLVTVVQKLKSVRDAIQDVKQCFEELEN